jgi:hypothetical protein
MAAWKVDQPTHPTCEKQLAIANAPERTIQSLLAQRRRLDQQLAEATRKRDDAVRPATSAGLLRP